MLNVFRDNTGTVEITSTDKNALNATVTYIREVLGVSNNKLELKIIRGHLLNIRLSALEADSYSVFWGVIEYVMEQSWEPYAVTSDTISFKKSANETINADEG